MFVSQPFFSFTAESCNSMTGCHLPEVGGGSCIFKSPLRFTGFRFSPYKAPQVFAISLARLRLSALHVSGRCLSRKEQFFQGRSEERFIPFPLVVQLCDGSALFRKVDKQKLADSARSANDSFVKAPLFPRSYRDVWAVAYHSLCTLSQGTMRGVHRCLRA